MDGVMGVMTALVMMAAPVGEGALEGPLPSGSWGGRTYVGVAVPLAPGGIALEGERELDDGFTVQAALGMGALYRAALPGVRPWTVTVAPRAQLSLGWSF